MKVFLTGATGYIGSAVAEKLQAAGHTVLALARSDASARILAARGYTVHRGDITDLESLAAGARQADAVIHAATTNDASMPRTDAAATRALGNALAGTGKPFIYTSGTWVYGDTGDTVADETADFEPAPIAAWRPAVEDLALAAEGVRSVVLRPAVVYGRGGGMPQRFIDSARRKGVVRYIGTGANRWPLVHVDDLADLYVRALDAPDGTLLLVAHGPAERVIDLAEAASHAAGVPGKTVSWPVDEARKVLGAFADACVLDQQISGQRAKDLLGWQPQAPSIYEEFEHGSYVD